jgi:4-amino-4-deoxy-L-arabinose transferase-like glycosyltransferase
MRLAVTTGTAEAVGVRRPTATGVAVAAARQLKKIPLAAWICALVACLNAATWSIVVPPFQMPDEPSHFAYVQQLAETGRLPVGSAAEAYSREERLAMRGLNQGATQFTPEVGAIASRSEQRALEHDLGAAGPLREPLSAGVADSEPPLYYALETIPYELGSGGTVLDRLELMRLLSALMAGVTGLFAFLFIRETLPSVPWAWTVGGLGVALTPMLAENSGAVNPDAMLFAVCAAIFYCLARAFRRGLSGRLAVAIGALSAIGFLTKLNFVGLAPGVALALVILTVRAARVSKRAACRSLALALAIAATPVLVYALINALSQHPALGAAAGASTLSHGSLSAEISYIWQFYLPRLPGMTNYFPEVLTSRRLWLDGFIGLFGWVDTPFPGWVYEAALVPTAAIAALCIRALAVERRRLPARLPEILVYAVMSIGVMVLVGADSYVSDVLLHIGPFLEPRYLLPMVPLFGALLALAARGAGTRWGPIVGSLIVVLMIAQDLFGQLQTISRFYG